MLHQISNMLVESECGTYFKIYIKYDWQYHHTLSNIKLVTYLFSWLKKHDIIMPWDELLLTYIYIYLSKWYLHLTVEHVFFFTESQVGHALPEQGWIPNMKRHKAIWMMVIWIVKIVFFSCSFLIVCCSFLLPEIPHTHHWWKGSQGPILYKYHLSSYGDFHYIDKMVSWLCYLNYWSLYIGKMTSWY